jgi:8-oxo-dGTP diphosphatase
MKSAAVCMKPHVVVAVFIIKDGKVLLGRRKGGIASGYWGPPGGKLEFGEELSECADRETLEEAGIKIKNLKFSAVVNDYSKKEKWHYTSVCYVADYASGVVTIMEPDLCSEWRWIDWNHMPKPLMGPMVRLLKEGFNPLKK